MSNLKKVESWQCTDNELFVDENNALAHQTEIDMKKALEDDPIMGNYAGSTAIDDDVLDWIGDHPDLVIEFIESNRSMSKCK